MTSGQLMMNQGRDVGDYLFDVQSRHFRGDPFCKRPHSHDDAVHTVNPSDNVRQSPFHLLQVFGYSWEESETGIHVGGNCPKRLVDFVGNGRCQFSHGRYPADMSQFGLRFLQRFFGPFTLGNVYDDGSEKCRCASSRRDFGTADVSPDHVAVLAPEAFLETSSLPSTTSPSWRLATPTVLFTRQLQ